VHATIGGEVPVFVTGEKSDVTHCENSEFPHCQSEATTLFDTRSFTQSSCCNITLQSI